MTLVVDQACSMRAGLCCIPYDVLAIDNIVCVSGPALLGNAQG